MVHKQYYVEQAKVDRLVARKNQKSDFYNGIYDRYRYPVLTREFAPVIWRYDLEEAIRESMASISGITRCSCRIPARRRRTYMICV